MRKSGYIKQVFSRLFNIQKGESKDVLLLLCFSFVTGVSFVFYSTATVSVFISSFKPDMLPYAFIASGIIGYLLWYGFARVQRKMSFGNLLLFGYIFLLLSIVFLFIMAQESGNRWWYFSMFVWMRFFTFLNAVMFGGLVARIFNLQQGKRLYALISAGDVVSQMLGYFSIPLLAHTFGVPTLFMVSLAGILLHLLIIVYVKRKYNTAVGCKPAPVVANAQSSKQPHAKDWKKYRSLLFVVSLLPMLGFYYVDYMFLNELRIEYTSKEAVAGFLGLFLGGVAVVELLTRLFLSGRLLTNYGLKFGINILPVVLSFSTVLIIFFAIVPGFGGLVFSMLALSKLLERVARFSFNEPAFQIFYQPVPAEQRFSFRTMLEGVPKALGVIIAGALILSFNLLGLKSAVYLNILFLVVLFVWLYVTRESYKSYCQMLKIFVQNKFSKVAGIVRSKDGSEVQNGFTLHPGKIYSVPTNKEWEEYQRLSSSIENAESATMINERHCVEFIMSSVLPGSCFAEWIKKDHMVGQLLKARFATSNNLLEQLRITELMSEAGDMVFLKEQLFSKHPLLGVYAAGKMKEKGITVLEGKDRSDCKAWIQNLVECIAWYEACCADLADDEALTELYEHLLKEKQQVTNLFFMGLSFIYDSAAVQEIEESLVKMPSAEGKMLAHELLENFFEPDIRHTITSFFGHDEPNEKINALVDTCPQKRMTVPERLEDIILKAYQLVPLYVKIMALKQLGKLDGPAQERILIENLQNVHASLASTAGKMLSDVNPDTYHQQFERLSLAQQKLVISEEGQLISCIEALQAISGKNLIPAGLLLPYTEAWLQEPESAASVSAVLVPVNKPVQLPADEIIFANSKTNLLVLKRNEFPAGCIAFKGRAGFMLRAEANVI